MSQPAFFVLPNRLDSGFYPGELAAMGAAGQFTSVWFYPGKNGCRRVDPERFPKHLAEAGGEIVFNGILLLPSETEYRLPDSATTARSGIHIPSHIRKGSDWVVGRAEGVRRYANANGYFSTDPGLRVQIFDKRCVFRSVEIRKLEEEADPDPVLAELEAIAKASDRIGIFGVDGRNGFVLEVQLGDREYPVPVVPVLTNDPPEPSPKRRRKKIEG